MLDELNAPGGPCGAGCDITLRNEVGVVLDSASVFSRAERVDYAAAL